jgi:hypothetical protein
MRDVAQALIWKVRNLIYPTLGASVTRKRANIIAESVKTVLDNITLKFYYGYRLSN